MKVVYFARPRNYREHLVLFLLGLAGLVDNLVIVGTLGFISCDVRPLILFSEWPGRYIGIEDQCDCTTNFTLD